jgi:hypothetical protein
VGFDLGQDLGHAVDVGFATEKSAGRKGQRLLDQMFAAAKPDLQPDLGGRRIEQGGKIRWRRPGDVEGEARQEMFDQIGLVCPQPVPLTAAEESAVSMIGCAIIGWRAACGARAARHAHRSVWNSRYNSRARGSIEEIYICS